MKRSELGRRYGWPGWGQRGDPCGESGRGFRVDDVLGSSEAGSLLALLGLDGEVVFEGREFADHLSACGRFLGLPLREEDVLLPVS